MSGDLYMSARNGTHPWRMVAAWLAVHALLLPLLLPLLLHPAHIYRDRAAIAEALVAMADMPDHGATHQHQHDAPSLPDCALCLAVQHAAPFVPPTAPALALPNAVVVSVASPISIGGEGRIELAARARAPPSRDLI